MCQRDIVVPGDGYVAAHDQASLLRSRHDAQSHQVVAGGNGGGAIRPVEQPARFRFTINRKTVNALGLQLPPELVERADEIFSQ